MLLLLLLLLSKVTGMTPLLSAKVNILNFYLDALLDSARKRLPAKSDNFFDQIFLARALNFLLLFLSIFQLICHRKPKTKRSNRSHLDRCYRV